MSRTKQTFNGWEDQPMQLSGWPKPKPVTQEQELEAMYTDKDWDKVMQMLRERGLVAVPARMEKKVA